MDENQNNTRRKFLKAGAFAGLAIAGSVGAFEVLSQDDNKKKSDTVKLLSPDGKIVEVDSSEINPQIPEFVVSEHNVREGVPGKKFVMVIDLSRCRNAGKCKTACSKMHYLPEDRSYIKINKMQDSEKASPYWMPTP